MADNTIVNASGNSVATFPSDSFADVIHATRACWASQGESKDGIVTVEEAELVRAIGDSLDTPIPPLLPGQSLGAVSGAP